ncbi:putative ABC transport system permease protein [Motilibacter peucedani]|uniref:Putative ABC transport system permease protein n=1 Tax=Motilibacter peucedani TaxID=598650 RepID=A0A420XJX4_9ACTN|nr:ABC transporter permease [Motilibacter peucedani]RKS67933.1 putative ABC transport system permease protein [Motilibacter peucedani]
MLRATFRSLLARKVRLVLSALAIVIGVGFVSGAFVLTDSLSKTFDSLFTDVNKSIAVAVRGKSTTTSDTRTPVPVALADTVAHVDGVKEAHGQVVGSATIVDKDGDAVGSAGPPTFGFNWVGGTLETGHFTAGGPPTTDDQVVLNGLAAEKGHYTVGDRVPVLTDGPAKTYTVSGVLGYDRGRKSLGGETSVWFTEAESHQVLNRAGTYDEIDLVAKPGVSQDELLQRVDRVLPSGTEALTGTALAAEQTDDIKSGLKIFNTVLLVFAAIALFVGAFIIFNTFSMLVAQRTRELALLRAIGASRGQVIRSVLAEAVVVGFIASALGLAAGIGISYGLKALLSGFGVDLPDAPTVIALRTVLVSFAVGILVTAVAALLPARRGSRIAPVAALRDAATADRPLGRQAVAGAGLLAVGIVGIVAGLNGAPLIWLGLGTLVAFLGISALSPLLARPIAGTVGLLFRRGMPGRLGGQNTVRNPRRTAVTASALMIGLALISGVSVLGASFKASVSKIATDSVGADFLLDTDNGGFPDTVVDAARGVPGVSAVAPLKGDNVRTGGKGVYVLAIPSDAVGRGILLAKDAGKPDGVQGNQLLVSKKVADDRGLSVGSSVPISFSDGSTGQFQVRGIYKDNALAGDYILSDAQATHFASQRSFAALVQVKDGAQLASVRSGLDKVTKAYPTISVEDRSEFVKKAQDQVGQLVNLLSILLALSVLIAILGVVNTLALSVIERTRELGLLRAVGMSRRQVKRMIRVESVVICVFGGILGLVVGTAIGVALQRALAGQGITELGIPTGSLVVYLVVAALAGVLAAVLPARRAARLDVLQAIATD